MLTHTHTESTHILRGSSILYITTNTEFANTEPSLLEEIQGYVPISIWSHFHPLPVYNFVFCVFYVCFHLKTPYWIYIADTLTLNARPPTL